MSDDPTDEKKRTFAQDLSDLFFAPRDAFVSLVAKNQFWIPMILTAVVLVGCMGVWASKVDPAAVVRGQLEELGVWEKIPADQRAQMLDDAGKGFAVKQIAGVALVPPLMTLLIAAVLLLIYRFAMDGSLTYRQSLTVLCWGSFAVTLVSMPLVMLTLALKGDWNTPLTSALNANLTLALSRDTAPKFLYSLASSLDLFSFWTIFLYATGFAAAAKRNLAWGLWGVTIPWAVYVLAKSGLASLF